MEKERDEREWEALRQGGGWRVGLNLGDAGTLCQEKCTVENNMHSMTEIQYEQLCNQVIK